MINNKYLSLSEITKQNKKEKIEEKKKLNLNGTLSIPSISNAYSIGVGIFKDWFFSRIPQSNFKYWTIDEANYNSALDRAEQYKNFKIQRPSLMIIPKMDSQYDREGLDHTLYGSTRYIQYSSLEQAFLKDPVNNIFLALNLENLRINFVSRIRVNTRSEQIDLYKKIKMNCRIGATETNYIDMDFHIPEDLMFQLANDLGFKVLDEDEIHDYKRIVDIKGFIKYLNERSQCPILYKFRRITGKFEFFIRIEDVYTHIDCKEQLEIDDGEQLEQIKTNYFIEMNVILDLGVPKFYAYYSKNRHDIDITTSFKYTTPFANIQLPDIPDVNDNNWNKYYEIDIEEEDISKPLTIEFEPLFEDDSSRDIRLIKDIIDHNNECFISPANFIEFKLFNNGQEVSFNIDWKKFIIVSNHILSNHITHLVMYIDRKYINEYKINLDNLNNNKFN